MKENDGEKVRKDEHIGRFIIFFKFSVSMGLYWKYDCGNGYYYRMVKHSFENIVDIGIYQRSSDPNDR